MALTKLEVRWAGMAAQYLPRAPGMIGGPGPDELAEALYRLRELLAGQPFEWANAPLMLLMAAVELAKAEAEAVTTGGDRLRELGLNDLAQRGDAARELQPEGAAYLGKAPPPEMVQVLDARIEAERPPIPTFIAPASTVADVQDTFGTLDDDALDELGPMGLVNRLDALDRRISMVEMRLGWVRRYSYGPSYVIEERAVHEALSTRRRDALAAFERSEIPQTWSAPECPRRMFERITLGNPPLAAEMMQRVPATIITDPAEDQ